VLFNKIPDISLLKDKDPESVASLRDLGFNLQNSKLRIENLSIDISSDKFLNITTLSKIDFEINKKSFSELHNRAIEVTKLFVKEKK